MLKNLGISGKLAVMLVVPLVGLAYFAGSDVVDKAHTASSAGRLQDDTALAVRVSAFVHEAQKERGMTALFVGSKGEQFGDELNAQRAVADRALASLRELAGTGPAGKLDKALAPLTSLAEHRKAVDALSLPPAEATGYYTKANAGLLDVVSAVADSSDDAALTRTVQSYASYLRAKEQTGLERAALAKGFTAGFFQSGTDAAAFLTAVAGQDNQFAAFARQADPADLRAATATVAGKQVDDAARMRALAISRLREPDLGGVDPKAWFAAMTEKINLMKKVEDRLAAHVSSQAGDLKAGARRALVLNLVVALLAIVAATALAVIVGRAIKRSVLNMLHAAEGIAEGDVDQELTSSGRDEIGRTTEAFARMIDYLRESAAGARQIADGDLTARVEPRSERDALGHAFVAMTANLNELVGQTSQTASGLSAVSQQMAGTSEEAGRATGEIAAAVGDVAAGAERQVQALERVKEILEEVVAATQRSAEDAAETARAAAEAVSLAADGAGSAVEASEAMQSVRRSSDEITGVIRELDTKSTEIGGIVDTITRIASQTNLLALNAAIEAARAGEHGRGFALVADEVRKLAEESQQAAGTIAELIGDIQAETGRAVGVVRDGGERTEAGATVVEGARTAFEQIGTSVEDMSRRVEGIAAAVRGIAASATSLQQQMNEVAQVAEASSASTEQVSASTQETSASTEEIAASAQELASTARELEQLVGRFTLARP
jgi:methyl-accepting chemotaxis protein